MKLRGAFIFLIAALMPTSLLAQESARSAKTYSRSYGSSGTLFDLGVYYGQSEAVAEPAATNEWRNTTSIYDVKLGYITADDFYMGLLYSTRSDNQLGTSASGNSLGAGLGLRLGRGFLLRAFYKFGETYGSYSDGSGYQADLSYLVNLSSRFYLGIGISARETRFKKNDTIINFANWSRKETYPVLSLGFLIN